MLALPQDAEIGLAIAIDVAGYKGIAAADTLLQLSRRVMEVMQANEGEDISGATPLDRVDCREIDLVDAELEVGDPISPALVATCTLTR